MVFQGKNTFAKNIKYSQPYLKFPELPESTCKLFAHNCIPLQEKIRLKYVKALKNSISSSQKKIT